MAIPSKAETLDLAGEIRRYEQRMSRLLTAFICSGLVYLLGPGSFLGLENLFAISHQHAALAVTPAWLQAHGQAEVYGWVGSFILGIGLHSLTRQQHTRVHFGWAWACWALWTGGVGLRWAVGVYGFDWRILLPLSAAIELFAYGIFQTTVRQVHKPQAGKKAEKLPGWVLLVLTGALGFGLTLAVNLAGAIHAAGWGASAAFPPAWDERMVALMTWAFLAPFVFGFSTRWLPVFAGLRAAAAWVPRTLAPLVALGAVTVLAGWWLPSAIVWAAIAGVAAGGLHLFAPAVAKAKTQNIHPSFPWFLRIAYGWLVISAALELWSAFTPATAGLGGAARHAFTVGFIATMVLAIGQRVLPAFAGMKLLHSPLLMLVSLAALEVGCVLRVSGEMLAYPGWWMLAWTWLPFSAGLEVAAFTIFAYNLVRTLLSPPAHLRAHA